MTFSSTNFDMGSIMNKLRSISEDEGDIEVSGKEIDQNSFSRAMMRLAAIKDAVGEDHYNDLRSGVRSMYMNRRPNIQQMTALMDLLETILSYVAEDNSLFQRLKTDLNRDQTSSDDAASGEPAFPSGAAPQTTKPEEVGAPGTATGIPNAGMRDMKT